MPSSVLTTKRKLSATKKAAQNDHIPEAITSCQLPLLPLPANYEPSEYDVICGRGRGNYNAAGNLRFRQLVRDSIGQYLSQKTKTAKTAVLAAISDKVRAQNNGACRFVKQQADGIWVELGHIAAREKVGHAMREALASHRKQEKAAAAVEETARASPTPSSTTTTPSPVKSVSPPLAPSLKRKASPDVVVRQSLPEEVPVTSLPSYFQTSMEPPSKKARTATLSELAHLPALASLSSLSSLSTLPPSPLSELVSLAAVAAATKPQPSLDAALSSLEARRRNFVFGRAVASLEQQQSGLLTDHTQVPLSLAEHSLMSLPLSLLGSVEWMLSCRG